LANEHQTITEPSFIHLRAQNERTNERFVVAAPLQTSRQPSVADNTKATTTTTTNDDHNVDGRRLITRLATQRRRWMVDGGWWMVDGG